MLGSPKAKSHRDRGFTLVEIMVIAPLVLLLIGGIITAMVQTVGEVVAIRAKNNLSYNLQDALTRIESDIELSAGFLATTDTAFSITSPQGFNNSTQSFTNVGSHGTNLLLVMPLTDKNPTDNTRQLVYRPNDPYACSNANVTANRAQIGVVAYFIRSDTLWRRVLMPPSYETAGCSTPWQQPSCLPGVTGTVCKTEDIKLVSGVTPSDFTVTYFNNAHSTGAMSGATNTTNSHATRQGVLNNAATIEVNVTVKTAAGGRDISQSMNARSTRLFKGTNYTQ